MLELLIAFVGGGALTAIINAIAGHLTQRSKDKKTFPDTIRSMRRIYSLLDELKAEVECNRVLICSVSNGGGIPRAGANLYLSALYETYDSNFLSISEWWQNRKIDESYTKLLAEVEDGNRSIFPTYELQDGILKDICDSQDIASSVIMKIKESDNKYYFIACNFKDGERANQLAVLHTANYVEKIRELIK